MNCQMKPRFNPSRLNAPYSRNQRSDRLPSLYSRKKTNMLNTKRTIVTDQGAGTLSLLMYWRSASIAIESSHRVVFFQRAFQIFAPLSPLSAVCGQVSVVPSTANRLFAVNHWPRCIRSIQRFQFLTHERHQRFHCFCAEVKAAAGSGKQFRQRARTAQPQRPFVVGQRLDRVLLRSGPDLERAELGDAVLYVVEWVKKNVELLMPEVRPGVLPA